MESSVKKIVKNILRVIWGNEETYSSGRPVSSGSDGKNPQTNARSRQKRQKTEPSPSLEKTGKLLTKETACTLTAKEVFRYTFTGSAPEIVTEKSIDGERSFVKECRYGKSSRCL